MIDENAKPITRYQNFLAAIANDPNAKQLKPITRKENILASAAGNPDAKDIEPLSYDEYYLKRALEAGGGLDIYEMEGTTTLDAQFAPTGFSLTTGDPNDIPNHKLVRLTVNLSYMGIVIDKIYAFLSEYWPVVQGFSANERYLFNTIMRFQSKILYVYVSYDESNGWITNMVELAQAAS